MSKKKRRAPHKRHSPPSHSVPHTQQSASTPSIVTDSPTRKPRLLWANPFCLLDTSSGASISVREMLHALARVGYEIQICGATIFDNPNGITRLREHWQLIEDTQESIIRVRDGVLLHHLAITASTRRDAMTPKEQNIWLSLYTKMLEQFKPDVVWFYGGQTLDLLIPHEARVRGIPSAAYLANDNYQGRRWCRDVDIIITDSQATANRYRERQGFQPVPVGKFIDPSRFVTDQASREHVTFINPSLAKGAAVVIQLALLLEQRRPDILFEVVESRGDWHELVKLVTTQLGTPRTALNNVIVTANTDDMRPIYARARIVLMPSLWWESSGRVLAEAMLNGIPVIITNRGGMPEMIGNGGIKVNFPDHCYEAPYTTVPKTELLEPLVTVIQRFFDDEAFYQDYAARARAFGQQQHTLSVATQRLVNALAPLIRQRAGDLDHEAALERAHKHPLPAGFSPAQAEQATSSATQPPKPNQTKPNQTISPDEQLAQLLPAASLEQPGSILWLIEKEKQFGGLVRNVARNKVSPKDRRTPEQIRSGGMQGGDRMSFNLHGYALAYASFLKALLDKSQSRQSPLTLVEVGILKGTGLAIWCDLFPTARVLGLDIDLDNARQNMPLLKEWGAFTQQEPELYEFDQYLGTSDQLGAMLKGQKVDIFIDDGCHTQEGILNTFQAIKPHLAENFVAFIEDNAQIANELRTLLPEYRVLSQGEMTVICPDTEAFPRRLPTINQLAFEIQVMQKRLGYQPNLEDPQTFNEKVVCRKLFGAPANAALLADKLAVRDYVKERVGDEILTKIYQVVESPEQIDWDALPKQFVMKSNHGNAQVQIVRDKETLDKKAAEALCQKWLDSVYGKQSNEYWYAEIPPKVYFEELLWEDDSVAADYKVHVFHEQAKMIQRITGRFQKTKELYYTANWTILPFRLTNSRDESVQKPQQLPAICKDAEAIAAEIDYLRVDFYIANGKHYFGECTLAPMAGWDAWKNDAPIIKTSFDIDLEIGRWWQGSWNGK